MQASLTSAVSRLAAAQASNSSTGMSLFAVRLGMNLLLQL
jgi:hypothetical protein